MWRGVTCSSHRGRQAERENPSHDPANQLYERSFATAEKSLNAYNNCTSDVALTELPLTYPTRLSLALNFSMFYYEILNSLDHACSSYLPHTPYTWHKTSHPVSSFTSTCLLRVLQSARTLRNEASTPAFGTSWQSVI